MLSTLPANVSGLLCHPPMVVGLPVSTEPEPDPACTPFWYRVVVPDVWTMAMLCHSS